MDEENHVVVNPLPCGCRADIHSRGMYRIGNALKLNMVVVHCQIHKVALEIFESILRCETGHDDNGHAFLKVPARSMFDLGCLIAQLVKSAKGT